MSSEGCCSWYHAPHSVTLCYYHKNRQNSAACRCVSETAGSRAELGQNSLLLAERVMGRDTLTHIFIRAVGCRLVFRYLIIIIMLSHRVSRVGAPVLQTTVQVIWLIKEVKHRLNLSLCRTVVIQRHLTYKQTDHPQGIYQQTTHRHGTRHLQTDRPPTEHHTWFTSPTNRPQLHCTSMCQCRVLGHRDHITWIIPVITPSSVDASSLLVPGVMLDARSIVPPGDCGSNITYTQTHAQLACQAAFSLMTTD